MSMAWSLDLVQDVIHASKMSYVDTDLCAWGAKDPCSGKLYHKTMRFACTFNMESLMCRCQTDHEHEIIQGAIKRGPHSRAGVGARFQGNILCHYAMHGHPLQKDSYRILDFTVAVGTSTHACLILIHWLRNLVRKRENSFRTSDLAHTLAIWLTSYNMFLLLNSRTEPSDHPAVDT